jgi:hypothetical protein
MNQWTDEGLRAFAEGEVDWADAGTTIRVYALSSGYTFSASDTHVDDLTGILDFLVLAGRTVGPTGILDADDGSFAAVASGQTITQLMVAKWTGTAATSSLLMYQDTNEDTTPISRTSDGSAIPLIWSATADAIARL